MPWKLDRVISPWHFILLTLHFVVLLRPLGQADPEHLRLLETANGFLVAQLPEDLPKGVETGEDAIVHIIRRAVALFRASFAV